MCRWAQLARERMLYVDNESARFCGLFYRPTVAAAITPKWGVWKQLEYDDFFCCVCVLFRCSGPVSLKNAQQILGNWSAVTPPCISIGATASVADNQQWFRPNRGLRSSCV